MFRHDLNEMFEVGMQLYGDKVAQRGGHDCIKIAMDYLYMMYAHEKVRFLIDVEDQTVIRWMLYENCGVHSLTISNFRYEFYLCEKEYQHGPRSIRTMLDVKPIAHGMSELSKDTVRKIFRQRERISDNWKE